MGGAQEGGAKLGVGGAADVEGRVHHHSIPRLGWLEAGGIGPVKARAGVGDVAFRTVQRGPISLDQIQRFDIGAGQDGAGEIAPTRPKIGHAAIKLFGQGCGQQDRTPIRRIGREHARQGDKTALNLARGGGPAFGLRPRVQHAGLAMGL